MFRTRNFAFAFLTLGLVAVAPAAHAGKPSRSAPVLTADAVVPGPGDTFASGTFSLKFSRNELCYLMTVEGVMGDITRISIHRGMAGTNGPEVFRLSPSEIGIQGLQGCRSIDNALAREISRNPTGFYILVQSTPFPNGALRGQVKQ